MDAVVSGSAELAILFEGDTVWSLRAGPAGPERAERRPHEIRYLLGDASDLTFLDGIDEAAVLRELDLAQSAIQTIHLALMLCDPATADATAARAARELAALLTRLEVVERAERILDAKPMPAPFSLAGAAERCRASGCEQPAAFFDALAFRQQAIQEVRRAWDTIPTSRFPSGDDRAFADGLMAREGLFRSLVRARLSGASLDGWVAAALQEPAVLRWSAQRWVEAWVSSLRGAAPHAEASAAPSAGTAPSGALALFRRLCGDPHAFARAERIAREVKSRGQVMQPAA